MNKIIKIFILFFGVLSCHQREWNNPFDPDCPKESYSPTNFKAEQQGNLVKLSWTQSNSQISGFKIERKIAGGSWAEVASPGKSITTWNDANLTGGKLHEYRLYAYAGSNLSNNVSAQITPLFMATLTTTAISNITSSSATSGGTISGDGGAAVTGRGVCWGTSQNPTITGSKTTDGTGTGTFTSAITGLTAGTIYYVRAYATNSVGTAYGSQVSFTTSPVLSLATVTTSAVTNYTSSTAFLGGNVTSDGNAIVTERGVCYSTTQNPTTANNKTVIGNGTGVFSATITGLTANTTYYIKAYAINSQGIAYGTQVSFTTSAVLSLPTVTTSAVTTYTSTTALLGGNVTSDGNATVTERGICYATTQNPTTANNKTAIGSGTGVFSTTVTSLAANTTYYVRAYAINSQGIAYGSQVSFFTDFENCGTVMDVNGNTYKTVLIGTQCWMRENLKTTKYMDGISIPNVTDASAWEVLTTGAYCWYNNDIANKPTYGALYNWYTVNTGKLCPSGWHVPSNDEWTTLENYLIANGYNYDGTTSGNKIAKSMAATTSWQSSSNTGAIGNNLTANNKCGFSGLPGGYRHIVDGTFHFIGVHGLWWPSTEYTTDNAWYLFMSYYDDSLNQANSPKGFGYSVRCLRDN